MQGRVGPPLAQPVFDLVKLGFKRMMAPNEACEPVFFGAPLVGAAAMLIAVMLVPIAGVYAPAPVTGDLIVLIYLLAIPGVALMIAGSASGSPYGAIGFSREMAMMIAYEGPIVLIAIAVALRVGLASGGAPTFSLTEIVRYQQAHGPFLFDPVMWPAIVAFAFFYPANLGIVPFDIPEAETEVLEGPLLEYSGPALALFKIMSALKSVVVLGLGDCAVHAAAAHRPRRVRRLARSDAGARSHRRDGGARRGGAHAHRSGLRLLPEMAVGAGFHQSPRRRLVHRGRRAVTVLAKLKDVAARSPWLYRINAGSCNGCDVELATTALIPRYDVERLGCQYCGSPRHADIVLITGPLTRHVLEAAKRVYAEIPDPKVTVAVGVCPISGGIFRESYAVCAPIDQYFPVDVNVPGCPPRPPAIIEGVAKAIAIWRERL